MLLVLLFELRVLPMNPRDHVPQRFTLFFYRDYTVPLRSRHGELSYNPYSIVISSQHSIVTMRPIKNEQGVGKR